ncbi:MAG: aminoacetone oxidase family FAD-binding enzyme [Clostridiales bacterium]|nr:aminoacetone oxidase family FAD-binding enzyme [Clostridiales bacterium]
MKILVIGGGMAGMTYAIVACKNGLDVTVAERNARVGKKIASTGNGKCNIGNARVNAACYNGSPVVRRVLDAISVNEYRQFLISCGIYTYTDMEGRMYPLSDSAANVVDCLRHQLKKFGATLWPDTEITACVKVGSQYQVTVGATNYLFDKVVLACGSGSQAERPNISHIIPNDVFTPTVPSLVPVKIRDMDGTLNGIRARANVSLYDGNVYMGKESGEVLFKDYGLSGICIFNLSALIARKMVQRKYGNYTFSVDVVPNLSQWDLQEILHGRIKCGERSKLFYGILHNKLAEHIVKRAGANADAATLAHTAKDLQFSFDRLLDWSKSQVTAGGVDDGYLDIDTLALQSGVVVLGELLNVDGICGGNNLYFAAASALYTFSPSEREKAYAIC